MLSQSWLIRLKKLIVVSLFLRLTACHCMISINCKHRQPTKAFYFRAAISTLNQSLGVIVIGDFHIWINQIPNKEGQIRIIHILEISIKIITKVGFILMKWIASLEEVLLIGLKIYNYSKTRKKWEYFTITQMIVRIIV